MTKFKKLLAGAAGAALITMTAAAPAQAGDIDVEEIIAGVAILGGVAVAINALDGDGNRGRQYGNYGYGYPSNGNYRYGYPSNGSYGYGNYPNGNYGYGNQYGYNGMGTARSAVNVCAREAQRYGGGQVTISDVDRDNGVYRVRGKAMVPDYNDSRYGRYDYDRESFTCHAANGRIYDFRI